MAKVSTAAQALGRIAGRRAGNSRWIRAGVSAAQTTLRSVGRVAHILWLQIAGLFFLIFAIGFAARLPHTWTNYQAGKTPGSHVILLVSLTVLFAWFGVSSFWRAKKR